MLEKIITSLKYGNIFCGIEHASQNGIDVIYSIRLKQSKKELNIEASNEAKTIEESSNQLNKNQHATLIINNNRVLSKQIQSEQKDPLKLVYKAFPNILLEDFYFEIISEKDNHFISLCRKEHINKIIKDYTQYNILITDFSLGNLTCSVLKSFIKTYQFQTSNSTVTFEDNTIKKIELSKINNQKYNINGIEVSNNQLLAFCGALQSVLKNKKIVSNFENKTKELEDNFFHKRFFNQLLKLGGLFILALLLANFFVFNNYFNKVSELKQVSEINTSTKDRIVSLNDIVSKKQKMVEDLLKSNGSKSSFYSDEIMRALPETILLSEFNYQPLEKRIKSDKNIELNMNTIIISGDTSESNIFSTWISLLEQKKWIKKVEIIEFASISSKTSNFSIKLFLSNDE